MTAFLMIFQRFSTTFRDFRRFSKIVPKPTRTLPNISQEFPKISQDVPRFPKITEDFRGRHEDVSMIHNEFKYKFETNLISVKSLISSHVRISNRFYQFVTTRFTTDFYVIKIYTFPNLPLTLNKRLPVNVKIFTTKFD